MDKEKITHQLAKILDQIIPSYSLSFWQAETELFGAIPEFDSMAIVTLIAEIEEQFDISVDDESIDADNFASVDSLATLILSLS